MRKTFTMTKDRPTTAVIVRQNTSKKNRILSVNSRQKLNMNKTVVAGKVKLHGMKNTPIQNVLSHTLGAKASQAVKPPVLEEIEKEMAETNQVGIKEMVEQASVEQRAISMIEDTLYLFNNNGEGKGAGIEKYELINKEEFENMKTDIENYRQKAMDLKEE